MGKSNFVVRWLWNFIWAACVVGVIAGVGWVVFLKWKDQQASSVTEADGSSAEAATAVVQTARLTPQAQKNLGLVSKPLELTTYWRKVDIPGVIVDRPGVSDRGVVAPVTGVITQIFSYPGDTVVPESPLFSIRLVSESLHTSQLELFKATREIEIALQQRSRLADIALNGAVAQSRIIEIDNQIRLLEVTVEAYRQDLQARGLPLDRIDAASKGQFVTEFTVRAPGTRTLTDASITSVPTDGATEQLQFAFELQELKVELGEQVEAGTVLCNLGDHRSLLIEGRGFKEDMPLIQESARIGWEIEVEYELPPGGDWPALPDRLRINHLANSIDVHSRTFAFYLALENQWKVYSQNDQARTLWRFRPGDRVQLHVAVEKLENVFVLPSQAVVRDGPEAFVFRHNGDLFDRKSVHILYEDRQNVVIANDGSLRAGFYFAQNGAASILRVMKAQAASGMPANVHVHADGTVHAAH